MTRKNVHIPKFPPKQPIEKSLEKFFNKIGFEVKCMINWLLFYKPKDKFDKTCHVIEVIFAYIILQYAWRGIFGF